MLRIILLAARNEGSVNLVSTATRPYYVHMSSALARLRFRLNNIFRPGGRVFYGWWIVAACAGVQWLAPYMDAFYGDTPSNCRRTLAGACRTVAGVRVNATGKRLAGALPRVAGRPLRTPSHFDYWYAYFRIGFFIFSLVESITTYFVAFIFIALGLALAVSPPDGVYRQLVRCPEPRPSPCRKSAFPSAGCVPFVMMGLEAFGWRSMALYSGLILIVAFLWSA